MIVLELFLFCLLFTAVVKIFVPHNAIEGLFFCPASVQERVIAMGKPIGRKSSGGARHLS